MQLSLIHILESLKNIMVTGSAGISVPIYQIADFESDNSPVTISKQDQKVLQSVNITPVSYTHLDVYKRQDCR